MSFDNTIKELEILEQKEIERKNKEKQEKIKKLNDEISKLQDNILKIYRAGMDINDPNLPIVRSFYEDLQEISTEVERLNLDSTDETLNQLEQQLQSLSSDWRKHPPFPQDYLEVVTQYISEAAKKEIECGFQIQIKKDEPFEPARRMFSDPFDFVGQDFKKKLLANVREENDSFDRVYGNVKNIIDALKPLYQKALNEMETNNEVSIDTRNEIIEAFKPHYDVFYKALNDALKNDALTFNNQGIGKEQIDYIIRNLIFEINFKLKDHFGNSTRNEKCVFELFRFVGNNLDKTDMSSAMKDYLLGPFYVMAKTPDKVAEHFGAYGSSVFAEVIKSAEENDKNGLSLLIAGMDKPLDPHQRKFIDLVYAPRLAELMQAVNSISSDYRCRPRKVEDRGL